MANTAQLDDSMVRAIDRVYARALLELAEEQNVLDDVAGQMADLSTLVSENPQFGLLLRSPSIETATKQEMLQNAFKDRIHPLIYQFVLVLQRKGRVHSFASIVLAFRALYNEKHGTMDIEAQAALPLDEATTQAVSQWISSIVSRKVEVHATVDAKLIGGMKFRAGDKQYDATVAAQLRQLQRKMSLAGETTARGLVNQIVTE